MNKRQQAKNDKAIQQWEVVKDMMKWYERGTITLTPGFIAGSWIVLDVNLHTVTWACFTGRDKGFTSSI
jgi:hypothetical protein